MFYLICLGVLLIGYLVGSIPTGYWIVKHKTGIDIREKGSGSTGATNVSRVLGKKWFFIVMFLDMLKGFLPVLAVQLLADGNVFYVVCMAIGLVLGHCFSCFLKFKGGKSVATGWGVFFAMDWVSGLIVFLVWVMFVQTSGYVSKSSIFAFLVAPLVLWLRHAPAPFVLYSLFAMCFIIFTHRENIQRLRGLAEKPEERIDWKEVEKNNKEQ